MFTNKQPNFKTFPKILIENLLLKTSLKFFVIVKNTSTLESEHVANTHGNSFYYVIRFRKTYLAKNI